MRPHWLDIAKQEMGVTEVPGASANPRIMLYFAACGATWVEDDATPWCGAGLGYVMKIAGFPLPKQPLRARSWATWGTPCELVPGAVAVLERNGDPSLGHVGIIVAVEEDRIYLLGFNQNDSCCIEAFSRKRIVDNGVRWPPGAPMTDEAPAPERPETETPAETPSKDVRGAVVQTLARSKTIFGVLLGFLGTLLQYLSDAASLLIEGAAELVRLEAVTPLLAAFGANTKAIGFGLAVFGLSLAFWRRVEAAIKGKVG